MRHEELERIYSSALNQLAPLVEQAFDAAVGLEASTDDPRITATWLAVRLRDHLRAFSVLLKARLTRDAESTERAAIEAAICLESLRAQPQEFMVLLRKDAASTVAGQVPIWQALDREFGYEVSLQAAQIFGDMKQPRLSMQALAAGAAMPGLYRRYKHLSATSVHVTGVSLVIDGGELMGLGLKRHVRRADTVAWMTHVGLVGGSVYASIMGYREIVAEMVRIADALEAEVAALEAGTS